jgi:hypothetical protein
VRRRRAAHRGDVVEQRAVGVVADRRDDRHRQQRDRAAQRLVAEAEEVGQRAAAARDDDHVDRAGRREVLQHRGDAGAAWRSCTGANAQTSRPGPPAPLQAGEHVVARLAALGGDHADRPRQRASRQRLLRREEPLPGEQLAQPVELGEQVALARPRAGR